MKKDFVIEWFSKKSTMTLDEIKANMSINYLEQGLIDSFAFLDLIASCEEKFGIRFEDDDFQKDEIFTIAGLISALENK